MSKTTVRNDDTLQKLMTVTLYNTTKGLSSLHEVLIKHMTYLVKEECRPASYRDFLHFEVDGIEYKISHGTFRNLISKSIKAGEIEIDYRSGPTYYTLKGARFGKPMTVDQTGVSTSKSVTGKNDLLYQMVKNLPLDSTSVHNINLTSKAPNIYPILSHNSIFSINPKNKGLRIGFQHERLFIGVVIQKTNTITVTIGCSLDPIPLNFSGIVLLSNALAIVRDRLYRWIQDSLSFFPYPNSSLSYSPMSIHIPHYNTWIVTMWHLDADSLARYNGKAFNIEFGRFHEVLARIYTKRKRNGNLYLRIEEQEYPNKNYMDLIHERLNQNIGPKYNTSETHKPFRLSEVRSCDKNDYHC